MVFGVVVGVLLVLGIATLLFVAYQLLIPTVARPERGSLVLRQDEYQALCAAVEAARKLVQTIEDPAMVPELYNKAVSDVEAAVARVDAVSRR